MSKRRILIINASAGTLRDSDLVRYVAAVQRQVSHDFAKAHGAEAILELVRGASVRRPSPDAAWVVVAASTDQARESGYRDLTPSGKPVAIVDLGHEDGLEPSVKLSAQVLELLADADGFKLHMDPVEQTIYAHDVCSPVHGETYRIGGVFVSNFVHPDWFSRSGDGPWDQRNSLGGAFELSEHGSAQITRDGGKTWETLQGSAKTETASSRHERRSSPGATPEESDPSLAHVVVRGGRRPPLERRAARPARPSWTPRAKAPKPVAPPKEIRPARPSQPQRVSAPTSPAHRGQARPARPSWTPRPKPELAPPLMPVSGFVAPPKPREPSPSHRGDSDAAPSTAITTAKKPRPARPSRAKKKTETPSSAAAPSGVTSPGSPSDADAAFGSAAGDTSPAGVNDASPTDNAPPASPGSAPDAPSS